jgi:hypothetical protein
MPARECNKYSAAIALDALESGNVQAAHEMLKHALGREPHTGPSRIEPWNQIWDVAQQDSLFVGNEVGEDVGEVRAHSKDSLHTLRIQFDSPEDVGEFMDVLESLRDEMLEAREKAQQARDYEAEEFSRSHAAGRV